MGLLDRFRAQPRWKHSNAAVRIAAVEELPLDQQEILAAIARDDREPHVRIAALKKVIAPEVIADVSRTDADPRVKEQATALLVDLALGAFEGTDEAESLAALAGLSEQKQIVTVAREASSEAVARAALARLEDSGSFGSVARRSVHPAVRLEALARLADQGELAIVALRSDYKDVSTAAVERLKSRQDLEEAANRAKNKTAAKRARARVREMDAEAAAAAAATKAAAAPSAAEIEQAARASRAAALCRRLEALARSGLDEGDAALEEIDRAWQPLGVPADDPLGARFAAAREAVLEALSRSQQERAERARLAQAVAEAVSARRAVCESLDGVAGDDTPARLEEARGAWAALPACPDPAEAARWDRRFDEGCRAAEARYKGLLAQRAKRELAARVVADLERLSESAAFPKARGDWQALRRSWNELTAAGVLDDAGLAERFNAADEKLKAREAEARELRARQQQENLARLQKLCAEVEAVAAAPDLTLKAAERALRDARAALDEDTPLPARQDHDQLAARFKKAMDTLFPRVQELRDMDDWQRWANAGVQEELCQQVEKLLEVDDAALVAKQLREAQARWKSVATAPRDQSQVLWTRFKAACDAARAKCDVFFAQLAQEQGANQARKDALCQQAEALSNSTDWIKTADAIKALQAEWKNVGPAPRTQEKALWERFHAACDAFFTRRREDLQHRKEEWSANLARKEALCAQAEATAETTEWQKGVEEIKRLQAEWKTIGPVRKARAEALWQRFRAACDRFFERYQQRDQAAASAAVSDADGIMAAFEALLPAAGEAPPQPEGLREQVMDLRGRWTAVSATLPRDRAMRFGERWTKAVSRLVEAWPSALSGTDWDAEANLRQMEELCVQVEQLLPQEAGTPGSLPAPGEDESPATLLARQLREALATNTIAGRQDDTARWKAASEQLRAAQSAWRRIGPVPEAAARALNARFQKACARASEKIEQRRRGVAAR